MLDIPQSRVYIHNMQPKILITMRLAPDLLERVDAYARAQEWVQAQQGVRGGVKKGDIGRTALITALLEALVEDRLTVHPREGMSPFPAEDIEVGSTPECPAHIWVAPPPEQPRKGWTIFQVERIGIVNPEFVRRDPETGVTYLMPTSTDTDPTEE